MFCVPRGAGWSAVSAVCPPRRDDLDHPCTWRCDAPDTAATRSRPPRSHPFTPADRVAERAAQGDADEAARELTWLREELKRLREAVRAARAEAEAAAQRERDQAELATRLAAAQEEVARLEADLEARRGDELEMKTTLRRVIGERDVEEQARLEMETQLTRDLQASQVKVRAPRLEPQSRPQISPPASLQPHLWPDRR